MSREHGGKQNAIANDVVCRIIMAAKRRGKKNVIYASFDRELVRIAIKNRREAWLMLDDDITDTMDPVELDLFPILCIRKDMIDNVLLKWPNKTVYLYGLNSLQEYTNIKAKSEISGATIQLTGLPSNSEDLPSSCQGESVL